jgi:hypothetical protein
MSRLHAMKTGMIEPPGPNPYPRHTRMKINYRETIQKKGVERVDRIEFLKSFRSDSKKKTQKACCKV